MPTLVKVRKWGNSLGLRLPKSFAQERAIADGATAVLADENPASPIRKPSDHPSSDRSPAPPAGS